MALDAATALELLRKLNAERDAYLESLNKSTELLSQLISSSGGVTQSLPRLTAENIRRNTVYAPPPAVESVHRTGSALSGDEDSSIDEGESLCVQTPLEKEEYTVEDLRHHIRNYKWNQAGRNVLFGLLDNETTLQRSSLFPTDVEGSDDRSHLSHASIYDVGEDGVAYVPVSGLGLTSRSLEIWDRLKSVNTDEDFARAVGKIVVIREPSPLLYAAIHYTMNRHFDMDELFEFLVHYDPVFTRPHDPFSDSDLRRRTFIVNMEYFTIIGENCKPASWQRFDNKLSAADAHIPITRCTAVIALSLEGNPAAFVKTKDRRATRRYGPVYEPFSPYRVLSIQAHPDWESGIDELDERQRKHILNGPEAFLINLRSEFRDAAKRLLKLQRKITDLIEMPADFIFNLETRDKLLFEDSQFTYSRRYFWAAQTLGIMNQDIRDMIEGYRDVFHDALWNGTDKIVWPALGDGMSPRYTNWRKRMGLLRSEIDMEIRKLEEIEITNEKRIGTINGLRDNLFSGTSVMESRHSVEIAKIAIQQGHNIRVLTLVTIFFLPLTFVTSVYGMTNMPPDNSFYHFGWTTLAVCLPTYILILSVSKTAGLKLWEQATGFLSRRIASGKPTWTKAYRIEDPEPAEIAQLPRPTRTRSTEVAMLFRAPGALWAALSPTMSPTVPDGPSRVPEEGGTIGPPYSPMATNIKFDLQHAASRQSSKADLNDGIGPTDTGASTPNVTAVLEKEPRRNMFRSVSEDSSLRNLFGRLRGRSRLGKEEPGPVDPC